MAHFRHLLFVCKQRQFGAKLFRFLINHAVNFPLPTDRTAVSTWKHILALFSFSSHSVPYREASAAAMVPSLRLWDYKQAVAYSFPLVLARFLTVEVAYTLLDWGSGKIKTGSRKGASRAICSNALLKGCEQDPYICIFFEFSMRWEAI